MPMIKYRVALSSSEREKLEQMLQSPHLNKRIAMHVEVLLLADENREGRKMSEQAVASELGINSQTVHTIRRRYATFGLDAAISRKPRKETTNHTRITPDVRSQILALSQTTPPPGKSRWTLRLLAHYAQHHRIIDRISHETVGKLLKTADQHAIIG